MLEKKVSSRTAAANSRIPHRIASPNRLCEALYPIPGVQLPDGGLRIILYGKFIMNPEHHKRSCAGLRAPFSIARQSLYAQFRI